MKKMKRKNVIILIILFIILFIVICFGIYIIKINKEKKHNQELTEQKKQQVEQYTKVSDFNSIEEVLLYLDSEFISQQNSEDENLDYVIKAKLKYGIDLEYKNYYEKLIEYSASAIKYKNFAIIDDEKNIEIIVLCNDSQSISSYYINNEKFYFDKLETKENIDNISKNETTKANNTCEILEKIMQNNWTTLNVELGSKESFYKNYDIYFDEGYRIRKINGIVYNIIFTEKYKENVIEELKVNSDKKQIENILGKPIFQTSNCLGYKTEKFYIFFSQDEISIYPVITYSTDEIIPIIENNESTKDVNVFINEFKKIWQDYDIFKTSKNSTILQYTLKGITIKLDNTTKQGIVLYSNYNGKIDKEHTLKDVVEKIVGLPENMNFINQDLVFLEEINRINCLDDYSEKDNFASKPILNKSSKFKAYIDIDSNQLCIVSINKRCANSELRENLDYGIWFEDNKLIYSVSGRGIYMYNAEERRYSTIVEGKENFKLIKIENKKLYYDEKIINL